MKRYFLFQCAPARNAYRPRGMFHWMTLPTAGGCIGVLTEEGARVPADWRPLPSLLSTTAAGLRDYGCQPSDTIYQAAVKISHTHPEFSP